MPRALEVRGRKKGTLNSVVEKAGMPTETIEKVENVLISRNLKKRETIRTMTINMKMIINFVRKIYKTSDASDDDLFSMNHNENKSHVT